MSDKTVADELALKQKGISVAEFFEKNRHLLGFDSKLKATITCVKEAVDNSIDASEQMLQRLVDNKEKVKKAMEKKKASEKDFKEAEEQIEKALPTVVVEISEAQEEYKLIEGATNIGHLIIRKDGYHYINLFGFETNFEKSRVKEFKLKIGKEVELEAVKNEDKNEYNITAEVEGAKKKVIGIKTSTERYLISITDNGPGLVKDVIPKAFGRLLYGSKFTSVGGGMQSRGQQGIGISASVLYSQLTTGRPTKITSKISSSKPAYKFTLNIDTLKNEAEIIKSEEVDKFDFDHGTKVELEIEGTYISKGPKSIYEFLKRTSIVNPHVKIIFFDPDSKKITFPRSINSPPKKALEIKPHPHGVELGVLIRMLKTTKQRTVLSFLNNDFCRVGSTSAMEILKKANISSRIDPHEIDRNSAEKLQKALQQAKLLRPPTDCLSPIGEESLKKSLKAEVNSEFIVTVTREPEVYRGNPFQVEVGIAYGGDISPEGAAEVLRFANKVPLSYEKGACATTNAVSSIDWRRYGFTQPSGSQVPTGPILIVMHICSVWVPFVSESKSAVANYPEILKEFKLALMEAARQIGKHLARKYKEKLEQEKIDTFFKYSDDLVYSIAILIDEKKEKIEKDMNEFLKNKFGKVRSVGSKS